MAADPEALVVDDRSDAAESEDPVLVAETEAPEELGEAEVTDAVPLELKAISVCDASLVDER